MFREDVLKALPMTFAAKDLSSFIGNRMNGSAANGANSTDWVLSTDAFIEGFHFPSDATPQEVAGKVLGAGLSNLAGSACRPRRAMVCLGLRRGLSGEWAHTFVKELERRAPEFDIDISVNDVVAAKKCTTVMIAVAGEPLAGGPIVSGGGNYGDALVVTGELGGSSAGRSLAPVPRLREIRLLMDFCAKNLDGPDAFPTAITDIVDGLATDLFLMCHEGKTGAVLESELVPLSPAAVKMAETSGRSALEHALDDGEDYELLIAMRPRVWDAFKSYLASPEGRAAAAGLAPFTQVGNLSSVLHLRLRLPNGTMTHLEPMGSVASRESHAIDESAIEAAPSRPASVATDHPQGKLWDDCRIAALRMIASGHKVPRVAAEFRVSEETVQGWIAECTRR